MYSLILLNVFFNRQSVILWVLTALFFSPICFSFHFKKAKRKKPKTISPVI